MDGYDCASSVYFLPDFLIPAVPRKNVPGQTEGFLISSQELNAGQAVERYGNK